jgi:hypothetical protein
LARWAATRAIEFKFDGAHPAGCSHHQKIVIADDCLAVCGGIDLASGRWDTPDHPMMIQTLVAQWKAACALA